MVTVKTQHTELPVSSNQDANDDRRLRHARSQHEGFPVGRYMQPAPMLFTRDGHNVFLGDIYRGHSAFLVCAGPSLTSHKLSELSQHGILAMSVNNAATVVRTQLWCSVDDPGNFADAIWRDPGILKFTPLCHMEKPIYIRDVNDNLVPSEFVVGDMPGVMGFRRNEHFNPQQWLYEDTFNWGNHSKRVDERGNKGSRSVMYVALRLLFYLGVRRVFLLGCDFRMKLGERNYAFVQDRSASSVRGNNSSYRILNERLEMLKESFDREAFEIYNCTPNTGLTVFPHVAFEDAIGEATALIPKRVNTAGLYDRRQREKDASALQKEQTAERSVRDCEPKAACEVKLADRILPSVDEILSSTTVILPPTNDELSNSRSCWETLCQTRPELKLCHTHLILPVNDHSKSCEEESDALTRVSPRRGCRGSLRSLSEVTASPVRTTWLLFLDGPLEVINDSPLLIPEWLAESRDEQGFVLAGAGLDRIRPATVLRELDDWAERVPELAMRPRVAHEEAREQESISYRGLISSYLFARTDWVRLACSHVDDALPTADAGLYLSYWAHRTERDVIRVPLERIGLRLRRRRRVS